MVILQNVCVAVCFGFFLLCSWFGLDPPLFVAHTDCFLPFSGHYYLFCLSVTWLEQLWLVGIGVLDSSGYI